jgi:catechol 2,3-dioxygenase-like lactoylglutathione lyase family enzyme
MKLEHINLVVSDIEQSLGFYRAAFPHWKVRSEGQGEWYGVKRNWIHFGDEYNYIALNDDGVEKSRDLCGHQIGLAHFAFVTQNLNALITRLNQAGFEVSKKGVLNEHRNNAYFIDPNGFEVEFVEYFTDIPAERNNDTL